jgi:hypothetical protein
MRGWRQVSNTSRQLAVVSLGSLINYKLLALRNGPALAAFILLTTAACVVALSLLIRRLTCHTNEQVVPLLLVRTDQQSSWLARYDCKPQTSNNWVASPYVNASSLRLSKDGFRSLTGPGFSQGWDDMLRSVLQSYQALETYDLAPQNSALGAQSGNAWSFPTQVCSLSLASTSVASIASICTTQLPSCSETLHQPECSKPLCTFTHNALQRTMAGEIWDRTVHRPMCLWNTPCRNHCDTLTAAAHRRLCCCEGQILTPPCRCKALWGVRSPRFRP